MRLSFLCTYFRCTMPAASRTCQAGIPLRNLAVEHEYVARPDARANIAAPFALWSAHLRTVRNCGDGGSSRHRPERQSGSSRSSQ